MVQISQVLTKNLNRDFIVVLKITTYLQQQATIMKNVKWLIFKTVHTPTYLSAKWTLNVHFHKMSVSCKNVGVKEMHSFFSSIHNWKRNRFSTNQWQVASSCSFSCCDEVNMQASGIEMSLIFLQRSYHRLRGKSPTLPATITVDWLHTLTFRDASLRKNKRFFPVRTSSSIMFSLRSSQIRIGREANV